MKKIFLLLIAATTLIFACQPKKDKYQLMADDLCKCMSPIADFQKRFSAVQETGDTSKLMAMLDEYQAVMESGEACAKTIEEKYGTIDKPDEMDKANAAFNKSCPEIAAMLGPGEEEMPMPGSSGEDTGAPANEAFPAENEPQKKADKH